MNSETNILNDKNIKYKDKYKKLKNTFNEQIDKNNLKEILNELNDLKLKNNTLI